MVERVLIQKSVHIKGAFTPNPSEPEFRTFRFDLVTGVKPPLDYGPEEKTSLGSDLKRLSLSGSKWTVIRFMSSV